MNIDEKKEIDGKIGIKQIKEVIEFVKGKKVDGLMGEKKEKKVKELIEKVGGKRDKEEEIEEEIEKEKELEKEGDLVKEEEIFQQIMKVEKDNVDEVVGIEK